MIYQLRTYNDLCLCKKYFSEIVDVKHYLRKVIKETEKFRSKLQDYQLRFKNWEPKVTIKDLENSIQLLKINQEICPEWQSLMGTELEIKPPEMIEAKDINGK